MSDHKHSSVDELEPEVEELNDLDVDTDEELEDVDVEDVANEEPKKAAKAKKETAPKRGDLPEGYVTPVGFAKHMTENDLHTDKEGNVAELKPQVVYSYIKNAPKDHPFPNTDEDGTLQTVEDSNGQQRAAFLLEEGIPWWTERKTRAAERKANAAAKAAKKTKKTKQAKAKAEADDEDLEEAVEAE